MELADFLEKNGIMRRHIAKKLGVSVMYISKLITKKTKPSKEMMKRIAVETFGHVLPDDWSTDVQEDKNTDIHKKKKKEQTKRPSEENVLL